MAEADPLTFTLAPGMAPAAPLMRLLASFDRQKLEAFAEISVAFLDMLDAPLDPDEPAFQMQLTDGHPGDPSDHEKGGDEEEAAWIEWHTQRANTRSRCLTAGHEDAEEDDAPEEDDGDSAVDDRPCDDIDMDLEPDHDIEIEQMHNDVPALPVFGPFNVFNDKRTFLGMNAETWIGEPPLL